ncbi:hypothetical protein LTR62_000956 [Meristemomyces frigidus]|uniref:Tubulin-specific chaperone D C-terminal domain-containing protein n=1 Tax=Meristemomyces frigidus TaxID=1508187 RepID=A0AAN7T8W4_9PEZI|nr:hypothetical protein LTR62_000956 [Meristemomyces frigidus]
MNGTDEDDADLKLVQASATLLSDLQIALPKILWRQAEGVEHGRVHTRVRQRDLDYAVRLIEPFQSEPQLLDAKLKYIVPPIVEAYLAYLQVNGSRKSTKDLPLDHAVCTLLYTLCKVRGHKVIVGFFINEARYLELILCALERNIASIQTAGQQGSWQVEYILLLWLSHLLLTPFDLATISDILPLSSAMPFELPRDLPPPAVRCLQVGLHYLPRSTKAQDAAADMLVRLVIRPDMQKLQLSNGLINHFLKSIQARDESSKATVYGQLGPLRTLAGVATSADLAELIPHLYRTCLALAEKSGSSLASNAVAKKLTVKIFRNVTLLSLRSASTESPLLAFLGTSGVLEEVIDYLLRALSDRDTPVRYAAAKAISLIIQELESGMGYQVIQAILDTLKEDLPRQNGKLDFRAADALKWHGCTLALAHALFKRTASHEQLPDIVNALTAALQFEQRTATGSILGINVRDAANFGIWSLSRRYTTVELLAVSTAVLHSGGDQVSVIEAIAMQLILSACLDPAGNIRRGSSAALQELIGRHPNEVYEGISLVQIVDYQAVGLRRRAMVNVASKAAALHQRYWEGLVREMLGWRGVGSPDVLSRDAAATSLASLSVLEGGAEAGAVAKQVVQQFEALNNGDVESMHGQALALAYIAHDGNQVDQRQLCKVAKRLAELLISFTPRVLRSELPGATAQLLTSLCLLLRKKQEHGSDSAGDVPFEAIEGLLERLLTRQEDVILLRIPDFARALFTLKQQMKQPLGCLEARALREKVAMDSTKSTCSGAGRAIALGALAPLYNPTLESEEVAGIVTTLATLTEAMNVDWRVIGLRSLQLTVDGTQQSRIGQNKLEIMVQAIHRGMNDYTVDERGDVGSLVRAQAISCVSSLQAHLYHGKSSPVLWADLVRLSLEKLDRVRLQAAQCRSNYYRAFYTYGTLDLASVSAYKYFYCALQPLHGGEEERVQLDTITGIISSAGTGAESLLVAARAAVVDTLKNVDDCVLSTHMTTLATCLKATVINQGNPHPTLTLLAFLLDMQIPQRLSNSPDFKWRNLLSTVQKSHHKSNDILRIEAAVHVYRGLAEIAAIREEVLKKLTSMGTTNPYPRVRTVIAEALLVIDGTAALG